MSATKTGSNRGKYPYAMCGYANKALAFTGEFRQNTNLNDNDSHYG
jgi:hypothetical protein